MRFRRNDLPLHVGFIRIPVQLIFVKLRLHRYRVIIIDRRTAILNLMHDIRGGASLCGASADRGKYEPALKKVSFLLSVAAAPLSFGAAHAPLW